MYFCVKRCHFFVFLRDNISLFAFLRNNMSLFVYLRKKYKNFLQLCAKIMLSCYIVLQSPSSISSNHATLCLNHATFCPSEIMPLFGMIGRASCHFRVNHASCHSCVKVCNYIDILYGCVYFVSVTKRDTTT